MKKLGLELDERELSTIKPALLLLQEQIDALPEDLSEMISEHGLPLTEAEIGRLADRIGLSESRPAGFYRKAPPAETLVEVEQAGAPALLLKRRF